MPFIDGVYVAGPDGALTFRWVKARTGAEFSALAGLIARRVGRFLESVDKIVENTGPTS
jgi:hypothetical protein